MIIMAKKKKHVHTEKERLFQEEAARKRADGAIGYSVSGGLAVLAGFIDGAVRLSARKRFKRT